MLTPPERALLFRACWNHPVAKCEQCGRSFKLQDLAADLSRRLSHLCPLCHIDLSNAAREHLISCEMVARLDAESLAAEIRALLVTGSKVAPVARTNRSTPLVLIAEDHAGTRELYSVYLKSQGWRVVLAEDGLVAIRKSVASKPDVIVMDLSLPLIDGVQVIRRLKRRTATSRIPIIACTGRGSSRSHEVASEAGCDGYVVKPCLPEQLLKEIHAVLARAARQERRA